MGPEHARMSLGFVADLHIATRQTSGKYVPLYDALMASSAEIKIPVEVKVLNAWAK